MKMFFLLKNVFFDKKAKSKKCKTVKKNIALLLLQCYDDITVARVLWGVNL